jgi:hypothetical protein
LGLEHTISAGERPQTYVFDFAASGTGSKQFTIPKYKRLLPNFTFYKPFDRKLQHISNLLQRAGLLVQEPASTVSETVVIQ